MKLRSTLPVAIGMAMLFSCSDGDENPNDNQINLSESSIEIDVDQDFKLESSFNREGYSANEFEWESDSSIVASVSNNGTITGKIKGETTIRVTTNDGQFSGECQVKVNPTNFLYKEPVLAFGESRTYVKNNESRSLVDESSESLAFKGENINVQNILYIFENDKLTSAAGIFVSNSYTAQQIADFVGQRYIPVGTEGGYYYFLGDGIGVAVGVISGQYTILYIEYEEDENGRKSLSSAIQKLKDKIQ